MRHEEREPGTEDDEARRVAEQMLREVGQPPDPDNRGAISAASGSQSATDPGEDRIERALIDMGAVSPEQTAVHLPAEER